MGSAKRLTRRRIREEMEVEEFGSMPTGKGRLIRGKNKRQRCHKPILGAIK
jgi:hypothetical protein